MTRVGFPLASLACAAARATSIASSAAATGASSSAFKSARRMKRGPNRLRKPPPSLSVASSTTISSHESYPFEARAFSRSSASVRGNSSNAWPEVMSSTARNQRKRGSGARAAVIASFARRSTVFAMSTARSTRAFLFSARFSALNVSARSQHASSRSFLGGPSHAHGAKTHEHKSLRPPGNACFSGCSRAYAAFDARSATAASLAAVSGETAEGIQFRRGCRSSAPRKMRNTPSTTLASLCARSAPPASAYSFAVPRHCCRAASNECMSALRSCHAVIAPAPPPPPPDPPPAALAAPSLASLGPFHTSECRGGVERRQMELKGIEGGDRKRGVGGETRRQKS